MPLIERKELGRLNLVDEVTVTTSKLDVPSRGAAKIFGGGILSFSNNVVLESLQVTATDNKTGGNITINAGIGGRLGRWRGTPDGGGVLYRGNICAWITDERQQTFFVEDCDTLDRTIAPGVAIGAQADANDCIRIGSTSNWICGDESGFSTIFTFVRPFASRKINQFGTTVIDWLPYDITIVVTGFELNVHVQDTAENEEQISCLVVDPNSKTLYGERPQQGEEQSDFVETQLQACRAAENIIWQQNKVLEANFTIPFRPAIRRGQTIRILNPTKSIDFLGIIKSFSHEFDFGSASVVTQIQATGTEYIFETASGLQNTEDKIDLRG